MTRIVGAGSRMSRVVGPAGFAAGFVLVQPVVVVHGRSECRERSEIGGTRSSARSEDLLDAGEKSGEEVVGERLVVPVEMFRDLVEFLKIISDVLIRSLPESLDLLESVRLGVGYPEADDELLAESDPRREERVFRFPQVEIAEVTTPPGICAPGKVGTREDDARFGGRVELGIRKERGEALVQEQLEHVTLLAVELVGFSDFDASGVGNRRLDDNLERMRPRRPGRASARRPATRRISARWLAAEGRSRVAKIIQLLNKMTLSRDVGRKTRVMSATR